MIRRLAWTVVALLALPALAGDHDQNYYHRTATKPPVQADFFLGPRIQYMDQLGAGVQFGVLWKKPGVMLLVDWNAVRVNAVDGYTTEDDGGAAHYYRDVDPFHVGARTVGQVGVSILINVRDYAKAAK